jgi:uncharacterized membrane protein
VNIYMKNLLIILGFALMLTLSMVGLVLFWQGVDELGCCGNDHRIAWAKIAGGAFLLGVGFVTVLAATNGAFDTDEEDS